MIAEKHGYYDVDFTNGSNVLTIMNVEIMEGEDIENNAFDFVTELVKTPSDWSMSEARLSK